MIKKIVNLIKNIVLNFFASTDRTYNKTIGVGSIETIRTFDIIETRNIDESPKIVNKPKERKWSFQKALISFRWTKNRFWKEFGGQVVLTKQPDTSENAYKVAEKLVFQMRKELIDNKRFFRKEEDFADWCNKWSEILEKEYGFKDVKKELENNLVLFILGQNGPLLS